MIFCSHRCCFFLVRKEKKEEKGEKRGKIKKRKEKIGHKENVLLISYKRERETKEVNNCIPFLVSFLFFGLFFGLHQLSFFLLFFFAFLSFFFFIFLFPFPHFLISSFPHFFISSFNFTFLFFLIEWEKPVESLRHSSKVSFLHFLNTHFE